MVCVLRAFATLALVPCTSLRLAFDIKRCRQEEPRVSLPPNGCSKGGLPVDPDCWTSTGALSNTEVYITEGTAPIE